MSRFRFNLTTLLWVTGAIAVPAGYISQAGFEEATFKIRSNELVQNETGSIQGDLVCECSLPNKPTTKMVCRIERSDDVGLLDISTPKVIQVRYRKSPPLYLFDKEDPYGIFLTQRLGFTADDIVGQIILSDESVVIVRQQLREE